MPLSKPPIGGDPKGMVRAEREREKSRKKHAGKSVPAVSLEAGYRDEENREARRLKAKRTVDLDAEVAARNRRIRASDARARRTSGQGGFKR